GNVDLVIAPVDARDRDRLAQRRTGEAHRNACKQRCALAVEDRMLGNVQEYVEIARRRTARTGLALARQANAGSVVDARRNFDVVAAKRVDPALSATILARL